MPSLRRLGLALAALGVALGAGAHGAAFFTAPLAPLVWTLHLGAVALGFAAVLTAMARAPSWWSRGVRWRALLRDAPPRGVLLLQLAFLNFLLHFGLLLLASRAGAGVAPEPLHGHVARMFSAGHVTVYLLCALAWWPPRAPDPARK